MRRRLLTIAIFLLAGTVVNVAVAWGCAMWTLRVRDGSAFDTFRPEFTIIDGSPQVRTPGLPTNLADDGWLRESDWKLRPEDDDFVWKAAREISGFGLDRKGFHLLHPDVTPGQSGPFSVASQVVRDRSGWPLRALQGELWIIELERYLDNPMPPRWFVESRFAIANVRVFNSYKGRMLKDNRLLAYLPVWPGFAVNTFFYAGFVWLLILGPFALRRLIRQTRGLCTRCAYPIGESFVCSECGCELPLRVRPAT